MSDETLTRYRAFISYNWADKSQAISLQRRLERFAVPRPVRHLLLESEPDLSSRRVWPIFRDDDEMTASGALDERLTSAIDRSAAMVLVASPTAAESKYVNLEVGEFIRAHGTDRLAIVVVRGSLDLDPPLPPAVRESGHELLWVDCRGKRIDRRSLVRVVAAVLGLNFDTLWRRHVRRRRKVIALWGAIAVAVMALVGNAIIGQRAAEMRSPGNQESAFKSWFVSEAVAKSKDTADPLSETTVDYQILRTEDLNGDGLLDFFVLEKNMCGSGGCITDVFLTKKIGSYVEVWESLGSSTPRTRKLADGSLDIVSSEELVSGQQIYSVYKLRGEKYVLKQYEFCDGIIYEMCDKPVTIEALPRKNGLTIAPGIVVHERPEAGSRPASIGAGASSVADGSQDMYSARVLGVLPGKQWYLVDIWKGSAGFVSADSING
ncbi:toll/interleukin-1 receptor domain-containing protein [Amycolatopsis sp. DG1A-15b]|uniref:toll/interleukin-1 receptor domain-containing protein n=1 Tax=Amycolatopsis sp. DG1A-15b TaxID=3052846 RepID=UPI00255BBD03|nr:toll/interleukin-1 receptor domain-containing protein [Amycolatopsis sp. DG1A-15b]WIX92473.1 toll/interleukin-1 receptor domain-containing protein [Amycolatopsis sp. DG1A-15b]